MKKYSSIYAKLLIALMGVSTALSACGAAGGGAEQFVVVEGTPQVVEVQVEPAVGGGGGDLSPSSTALDAERLVVQSADLVIVATDPAAAMDNIAEMAQAMGGYVVASNVRQVRINEDIEVPRAIITVRVPARRMQQALEDIEEEAIRVDAKDQSGQDVTAEYTDLESRLRNLERAEAQLTEIMNQANETDEVLNVFNRLNSITEQAEVIQGQLAYFDQASAFSSITVTIQAEEPEPVVEQPKEELWQANEIAAQAVEDLKEHLRALGGVAIRVGLYTLPLLILYGLPIATMVAASRRWLSRAAPSKPPAAAKK